MDSEELFKLNKSKDVNEVIKFYDYFNNSKELISWLKSCKYAPVTFHETEDESDIVVVVTIPSHKLKTAKVCQKLFKGLKIIFSESSGPNFDFARSANMGMKQALKHKPKWIIQSNDDMFEIDKIRVLVDGLENIDSKKVDAVFRNNYRKENGRTVETRHIRTLAKANPLFKLSTILGGNVRTYVKLMEKFDIDVLVYSNEAKLTRKIYMSMLMNSKRTVINSFSSFFIFNSRFVRSRKEGVFDDVYRNDTEDIDLDLYVHEEQIKHDFLNYNIGHYENFTQGASTSRVFRNVANSAYFCDKIRKNNWL